MFVGFVVGDLPDDGIGWAAIKLAFAILILWTMARAYRRSIA